MTDALTNLYNDLVDLSQKGDETAARAELQKRFPTLPEDVQAEILSRLYLAATKEEAASIDDIAKIQERGLMLLEALEVLKSHAQTEAK